jgi:HSP20 family protein
VILIDLPGFQKKDIQLSISNNILTIRAKRTLDVDTVTVHYRQRPSKIEKRIPLPISNIDQENINSKASYVNGVVTLRVPLPQTSNIPIT